MKRGLGILFAGVLSISAVQYGQSGQSDGPRRASVFPTSGRAAPGPQSSSHPSAQVGDECPDFHGKLLQFIGDFSDETQPVKRQFLIATLPDPVHTHLSLFFDRNIDMIEEAAQTAGYIFDRQLLPWDNKSHPEPADFRIRDKEKDCTERKEKDPGVLIFRPTKEKEKEGEGPLFVLVVGEQPTGGINYPQFYSALKIIQEISPDSTSLRILGPTFSGSLYSLDRILRSLDKILPKRAASLLKNIYVHSGTVTSWSAASQFIQDWCNIDNPKVQFVTFQESDQYRLRHFLHQYIETHGYKSHDVAQLSEGETAYGRVTQSSVKNQTDVCLATEKLDDDREEPAVLQLYFPREISQLRSAYQHDIYMDQGGGNSGKSAPRSTLKLDFDNAGSDGDSIPSFSGKQLPLSEESILLGIVTSLQKHHSRFLIIRATDPLDELFLSRFLRQAYPDGRVITLNADLLYDRQEDTLLRGVWAMSSYPLITDMHSMLPMLGDPDPKSDPKANPKYVGHVDRNFPFSYGVGTYNALLSLLTKGGPLVSSPACPADNPCVPAALYEQYGWPTLGRDVNTQRLRTPPLWLSVMGRNGYWPMALLDDVNDPKPVNPPSRLHEVDGKISTWRFDWPTPAPWAILCGICVVLALVHLLLVWTGSSMSRSEAFAQFAPHRNWRRIALLFLAGMSILIILETLVVFDTNVARSLVLCVTALVFAAGFLLDLYRRQDPESGPHSWGATILSTPLWHVIWFATITAIIFGSEIALRKFYAPWKIFLYRSVHIASAVSPIVPVLLLVAGVYWCVWHCLSGASLLDRRRPRLPDIPPPGGLPQLPGRKPFLAKEFEFISFDEMQGLSKVAKPFKPDIRITIPLIVLAAVAPIMFNYKHPVEGLEGWIYDYVYAALLLLISGMLLSNLFRFLTIWLECRRLLVALDRLPLRRAFRNLHGFSWKPIWRPGGSAFRDSLRMLGREVEGLCHLRSALKKHLIAENDIPLLVDAAQRDRAVEGHRMISEISALHDHEYMALLTEYHAQDEQNGWNALIVNAAANTASLVNYFRDLQQKLAEMCAMALNYLQPEWAEEEEPVANTNGEFKPSKDVQIAEEFVALVYSSFIMNILLRLRTLIMCVTGMFIFILLSINSYPFQPQSSFRVLLVGLFVLIGGVVGSVYAQMHRDSTLSLLTDTDPGKLGSEFWIKLLGFGAVPLISLLASQFPEVNRFLFSWLQPALEALK